MLGTGTRARPRVRSGPNLSVPMLTITYFRAYLRTVRAVCRPDAVFDTYFYLLSTLAHRFSLTFGRRGPHVSPSAPISHLPLLTLCSSAPILLTLGMAQTGRHRPQVPPRRFQAYLYLLFARPRRCYLLFTHAHTVPSDLENSRMWPLKGRHFLRFPTSAYMDSGLHLEAFSLTSRLTFDAVDAPNWTTPTLTFGPCAPIFYLLSNGTHAYVQTACTHRFHAYFSLLSAHPRQFPLTSRRRAPSKSLDACPRRFHAYFHLTFALAQGISLTFRWRGPDTALCECLRANSTLTFTYLLLVRADFTYFLPMRTLPGWTWRISRMLRFHASACMDFGLLLAYFYMDSCLTFGAARRLDSDGADRWRADSTYFPRRFYLLSDGPRRFRSYSWTACLRPFRTVFTLTFPYFPLSHSNFCLLSDGAHPPCPSAPIPRLLLLTFRSHAPIFTYFPAHAHGLGISLPPALQGRSFSRFHSGEFLQVPRRRRRFLIDSLLTLHRNLLTSGPCQRRFSLMPGRRGTPQTSKEGLFLRHRARTPPLGFGGAETRAL
jgi:hypothetical protein